MSTISVAIAGSTTHTLMLAEALSAYPDFSILWILTPTPKLIGRDQLLTQNPLHLWAISNQLPAVTVEKRIDEEVKKNILALPKPDILLVVDFGYMIPDWLLELPTVAPVNVHPSALPDWRGSSPGQFVLLAGETKSAISTLVVTAGLDSGPLIHQEQFTVNPSWTQAEYYTFSFQHTAKQFPEILRRFVAQPTQVTEQPQASPTPIARRLDKRDSFISWQVWERALTNTQISSQTTFAIPEKINTQPVLETLLETTDPAAHPHLIEHACRAFNPWPLVWTEVDTIKGIKRMQVLACSVNTNGSLQLETVKIEGLSAKPWNEVKNQLKK